MSKRWRLRALGLRKPPAAESRQDFFGILPLREAEHEVPLIAAKHRVAARRKRQPDAERKHQAEVVAGIIRPIEDHLMREAAVDFLIRKLAHVGPLDFVFMICSIRWLR